MIAKTIEVLDPTAKPISGAEFEIAPRVDDLNGKVIGLLDNGKPNFSIFLSHVEELLRHRFKPRETVYVDKRVAGDGFAAPLPAEPLGELAAKCDVVINGMCD